MKDLAETLLVVWIIGAIMYGAKGHTLETSLAWPVHAYHYILEENDA